VTPRFWIAMFAVVVLIGCSQGHSPVAPSMTSSILRDDGSGSRAMWGMFDVYVDTRTGEVGVVPVRGADFECNVVNFLQPPKAPINLLKVVLNLGGTDFSTGKVSVDVSIRHPFPGTKYCGFDVMGIVMDDYQPSQLKSDPSILCSMAPSTLLKNADGWTRWWNQPEFSSYNTLFGYIDGAKAAGKWTSSHTLNAFKYFSDDLVKDAAFDPNPSARGFFSSENPGINARRYELQFPMDAGKPVIHFKYAVSASYVVPFDTAKPPYTADEWPITANMPEAYKIDIIDNGSTAF